LERFSSSVAAIAGFIAFDFDFELKVVAGVVVDILMINLFGSMIGEYCQ
jgi:hypothetical protein